MSNHVPGLVSVIVPVYNRPAMLQEAVQSALDQTWPHVEIIIVDDGSTDTTPSVAEALAAVHSGKVRVLRQANAGPGEARQRGLKAARGEFVQFLDSDDLLLPRKFELQIEGLRADSAADISYGKTYASDAAGHRQAQPAQRTGECLTSLFPALLQEPLWPTLSPLYRHSFLERVGPWPRRKQLEDWEYDAQAGALGARLHYCGDAYIAETRNHAGERLCSLWRTDAKALSDRAHAYMAVLQHARAAGVPDESSEMQRFARSLFWMARSTAAYGLDAETRQLLGAARSIARAARWQMHLFGGLGHVLGWRLAGRVASVLEGAR